MAVTNLDTANVLKLATLDGLGEYAAASVGTDGATFTMDDQSCKYVVLASTAETGGATLTVKAGKGVFASHNDKTLTLTKDKTYAVVLESGRWGANSDRTKPGNIVKLVPSATTSISVVKVY